jgi:hypothetical protein
MKRISVKAPEEDRLFRTRTSVMESFLLEGTADINIEV